MSHAPVRPPAAPVVILTLNAAVVAGLKKTATKYTECSKNRGKLRVLRCQNTKKNVGEGVNFYICLHLQSAGWAVGPSDSQRGELPPVKGSHDVFILRLHGGGESGGAADALQSL